MTTTGRCHEQQQWLVIISHGQKDPRHSGGVDARDRGGRDSIGAGKPGGSSAGRHETF